MEGPCFQDMDRVIRTHRSLIETYGGIEGLRDAGLLHSAVAMSQASFGGQYLHHDLFEMAAAYLFHIVQYQLYSVRLLLCLRFSLGA